jgi:DNA-binding NarL/FixJ family response regulator
MLSSIKKDITQPDHTGRMEKTKVFLSDAQVLFREGIHFVLSGEEDFDVIGETTGNGEALALIELNPPHVAILGEADALLDGAEAARRVRRNLPAVAVVLTMEKKDDERLFNAIRSGACACLAKDAGPEHLLDLLREIARGGLPAADELLQPGLASLVLSEFKELSALNERLDHLLAGLSPKETQLLSGIAAGDDIKQLASRLKMSEASIRHNLKVVLTKLVANDQVRSVLKAARKKNLPAAGAHTPGKKSRGDGYVTRAEFKEFQETLMAGLRAVMPPREGQS